MLSRMYLPEYGDEGLTKIIEDKTDNVIELPKLQRKGFSEYEVDTRRRPYYLATPYSKHFDGLETAYEQACEQLGLLLKSGYFVFCPIVHSHGPNKYIKNDTHDFWLNVDFDFLSLCKGLIICRMPGWELSFGINEEIKFAIKNNIPIYYCDFLQIPEGISKN